MLNAKMAVEPVQRRLAAILAADVLGYSRLVREDEEGTLSAVKSDIAETFDPCIEAHNGRTFKTLGDGLLVEFASVVDAVRCAVEVQRAMEDRNADRAEGRKIEFRIGINLGDVVADREDLHGDGVNVAARLEGLAEPGGIWISGSAFEQVRDKLKVGFEDTGDQQVKNIDRPVRAYRVVPDQAMVSAGGTADTKASGAKRWRIPAIAAAVLVIIVAGGLAVWQPWVPTVEPTSAERTAFAVPDKPSIAVLPFDNMSDDPSQEYFVNGMTEDLITDLSKISGLFVIARNSVFAYKNQPVKPQQVAEELGVRYVLEGSVRRAGNQVRINAQLIDAVTGGHLWAERFDRALGDIFALQDDVTKKIVSALALELTPDEKERLSGTDKETSPEVYDLYLRGVEALRQFTPESISEARVYFLKALSIDPDYARAYATMAFTYTAAGIFYRAGRSDEAIKQALRYGERALALSNTLPQAHFAMAIAYLRQGRHDDAIAAAEKAIKYDPNYSDGYVALANVLVFLGNGEEAEKMMRHGMELNPRYSAAYIDILGRAFFVMGRYDKSIGHLHECISRDPGLFTCHVFLAAAYGSIKRIEDAEWEVEEILNLEPDFSLKTDIIAPQFQKAEDKERFQTGLRRAGIPEK